MNTPVNIDFFLATRSEKSKTKIIKQIKKTLAEEFPNGILQKEECLPGCEIAMFQVTLSAESWEHIIFRVLQPVSHLAESGS